MHRNTSAAGSASQILATVGHQPAIGELRDQLIKSR
jgi:hypothetical protein